MSPAASDELMVMLRPSRHYAALAETSRTEAARELRARLALWALAMGGFVSLTAAGRLTLGHMLLAPVAWSFLLALQGVALSLALRAVKVAPEGGFARAFALYLVGHGPWYLLLLGLAGVCLFAPDVANTFRAMLRVGVLPLLLLTTLGWGARISAAFFRHGLRLSTRDAVRATASFYFALAGAIVGWYVAVGQLLPLFGVVP